MCTTGQRSKHGSPNPLDRMNLNHTCRACLFLSLDQRDQQQLDCEVTNFRCQAYAPGTKSTYMSLMLSYLSFCVYQPLPAAAAVTLNRYASFLERSPSASSIPAYLNAVPILQLEHGLTHPTKKGGIKRLKGLTVLQKKSITPQILLAFKSHLNLDNPLHATFWEVCLVTFFGLLRKANLQCKGFTQFDPSKHLRRGDILFFTDWNSAVSKSAHFNCSVASHCPVSTLPLYSSQTCLSLGTSTFIGSSLHPSINWGRPDCSDLWKVWLPSKAVGSQDKHRPVSS